MIAFFCFICVSPFSDGLRWRTREVVHVREEEEGQPDATGILRNVCLFLLHFHHFIVITMKLSIYSNSNQVCTSWHLEAFIQNETENTNSAKRMLVYMVGCCVCFWMCLMLLLVLDCDVLLIGCCLSCI